MVIGTTSEVSFLDSIGLCSAFGVTYPVPTLRTNDAKKVIDIIIFCFLSDSNNHSLTPAVHQNEVRCFVSLLIVFPGVDDDYHSFSFFLLNLFFNMLS